MDCAPMDSTPVPPDEGHESSGDDAWPRRQEALADLAQDGFAHGTPLERYINMAVADLFHMAGRVRQLVGQVEARTSDPQEKLVVVLSAMPEFNKSARETRTLLEALAKIDRHRYQQEVDLLKASKPR